MAAPVLPSEVQGEYDDGEREYRLLILTQEYEAALSTITRLRDKMLKWQEQYGRRFHKGLPIHNIGFTLTRMNRGEEALRYFILAYIEDLLSADNEDEADSTAAGKALLIGYGLPPDLINLLKQKIRSKKEKNDIPMLPESALKEVEREGEKYNDLQVRTRVSVEPSDTIQPTRAGTMRYDLFIAHASEDKPFVARLAKALVARGLKVWYDDFILKLGDSLRREIDKGLVQSDYGVVVLSHNFFNKLYPQKELDGLAAQERLNRKVILPVWHKIDRADIERYSPTLADLVAIESKNRMDRIVGVIIEAIS